jgi:hypothetical protein
MVLNRNMGAIDRLFRVVAGGVLIYIGFVDEGLIASETLRYTLGVLGLLNAASAAAGICPLYIFANINTQRQV